MSSGGESIVRRRDVAVARLLYVFFASFSLARAALPFSTRGASLECKNKQWTLARLIEFLERACVSRLCLISGNLIFYFFARESRYEEERERERIVLLMNCFTVCSRYYPGLLSERCCFGISSGSWLFVGSVCVDRR